ncbi:MAG: helix-turn-helix domain-containing protein [Halieaceae bacterium]
MVENLSCKKLQAIPLLAKGTNGKKVAEIIDVSAQTISEWKNDPVFEAALNSTKWEILKSAVDKLRAGAALAAEELTNIIQHAESDETRRKACLDVLNLVGISDPQQGALGLFIGSTDPLDIKTLKSDVPLSAGQLAAIMEKLELETKDLVSE